MIYKIPATWQVSGILEIEAESLEEAIKIAEDDAALPEESDYIDDSFEVNQEMIEYYNEKGIEAE